MMREFHFTLQKGIVTLLTVLLTITGGIVTYTAFVGSKESVYATAENMMLEISKHVLHQTLGYLEPASKVSKLTYHLINRGLLPLNNETQLLGYFHNILTTHEQFVMVYFGNEQGSLYMVKRMPDNSFSLRWVRQEKEQIVTTWEHENPIYNKLYPNTTESLNTGYDPRKRPWYQEGIRNVNSSWTDIYVFNTDNKPGISNAIPVYNKIGKLQGVFSIDIGTTELSYFLASLKIGKQGKAFLLNQDKLVALPILGETELEKLYQKMQRHGGGVEYHLHSIETFNDGALKESFRLLTESKQRNEETQPYKFFFYPHQGKNYLVMYMPFPQESGFNWLIGIILPEEDIMETVYQNNRIVMETSAILISIAIVLGTLLSRLISQPLTTLSHQMDEVKKFDLESKEPVYSLLYEVKTMTQSFNGMKQALRSFQKYIPKEVVGALVKEGKEAMLGGEKRELTIFFSDIFNFTGIAESLTPEMLVDTLGIYFREMSNVIIEHQGTVDKYIGDAIMAFWGAPKMLENHSVVACHACLHLQRILTIMSQRFLRQGKPTFPTRMGLSTGTVIVGNIGSEQRLNYTVLGDSVNLASRVEGLNKFYGTQILITESTYERAQKGIECRWIDCVTVKGKKQGVAIYELVAEKDNLTPQMSDFLKLFGEAIILYQQRQWMNAIRLLGEIHQYNPNDKPTKILLERCKSFTQNPPPQEWSGIITLNEK